jgi:hypothetical protein
VRETIRSSIVRAGKRQLGITRGRLPVTTEHASRRQYRASYTEWIGATPRVHYRPWIAGGTWRPEPCEAAAGRQSVTRDRRNGSLTARKAPNVDASTDETPAPVDASTPIARSRSIAQPRLMLFFDGRYPRRAWPVLAECIRPRFGRFGAAQRSEGYPRHWRRFGAAADHRRRRQISLMCGSPVAFPPPRPAAAAPAIPKLSDAQARRASRADRRVDIAQRA